MDIAGVTQHIPDLTGLAGGLAAIAIAVLVLGPTVVQMGNSIAVGDMDRMREYRRFRLAMMILSFACGLFLIAVAIGVVGILFPTVLLTLLQMLMVLGGVVLTLVALVCVARSRFVTPSRSQGRPF